MIDIKDLRIGNVVLENDKPTLICDYLSFLDTYEYKPIKLTEDILKQLGFTYNEVYQLIDGSSFTLNDDFTICDIDFYVKCEYLHELQNAYKVLKGKELPININTLKI
jgi:hypothetical protein